MNTYQRRNRLWHWSAFREVSVCSRLFLLRFKSLTLFISLASLHQRDRLSFSSLILTVIPVVPMLPGDSRGKQLQLPSFLFWLRSDRHNAAFISLVNIELWRPNATVKARFVDRPIFMWMVYSHHTAQSALTSEWWDQQKQLSVASRPEYWFNDLNISAACVRRWVKDAVISLPAAEQCCDTPLILVRENCPCSGRGLLILQRVLDSAWWMRSL